MEMHAFYAHKICRIVKNVQTIQFVNNVLVHLSMIKIILAIIVLLEPTLLKRAQQHKIVLTQELLTELLLV